MPDPVIQVIDLTRVYQVGDQQVHALSGISLSIERGELVAIMGASGSGKSTLMGILGCLDQPSSGSYVLDGVDVARLAEPELARIRSERLGFVFQTFNLLPRTSAIENVALPLFYGAEHPTSRLTRTDRARKALATFGLGEREENTPAQLSGGQQQRVAIARALINSPGVLLADEPTGNLDTRTSHEIMDTLVALNRHQGVTVIIVTHESDIAAYADRVITVRDGRTLSDEKTPHAAAALAGNHAPPAAAGANPEPVNATPVAPSMAFGMMIVAAAVQALWRNRMRSALTMLGIFIGVAALIVMVAVGQGANDAVRRQIESLGTNLLVVVPGATTSGGVRAGSGSASTLTVDDTQSIQREDTAVGQVSFLIRQSGQVQYGNQNWTTSILGVSINYPPITNWRMGRGSALTEQDDSAGALVVLIGQTVYRQLFPGRQDPLGATILVKSTPLRVIGLLEAKGQTSYGQDQDDLVMIPFTTAQRKVLGVATPSQVQAPNWVYPDVPNPYGVPPRMTGFVNQIFVQAASAELIQTAVQQVNQTLTRRHRIRLGDTPDFAVRNLSQIADTAQNSSHIMSLLLAAVASISLLVGGIGIMNILLVSVTERTREIGLRMAIGAHRMHVLLQFLAEAVTLSIAGGAAGILFGIIVAKLVAAIAGWPTPLSFTAILGGFLFSASVGVFFGYYPARKASGLNPIEALRYE